MLIYYSPGAPQDKRPIAPRFRQGGNDRADSRERRPPHITTNSAQDTHAHTTQNDGPTRWFDRAPGGSISTQRRAGEHPMRGPQHQQQQQHRKGSDSVNWRQGPKDHKHELQAEEKDVS